MPPRCRFARQRNPGFTLREEPFRMFFPLGILASVLGVSLWPMVYAGLLGFFPGEAHARLMIQGFVGGFALGFLGTAFPKMIESTSLTWPELGILLASYVSCIVTLAFGNIAAGDSLFLFTWIFMVGCLGVRLSFFRKDLPPPGFILAGIGLASGITGTLMLLIARLVIPSDFQRSLAQLLLYEAFILGPIVGIGSMLFPRFFTGATSIEQKSSWNRRALIAFLVGIAILVTYLAQAAGWITTAPVMRAVIVATYLLTQVSPFRRGANTGSLSSLLRVSIVCLILGILISGISPTFQVAMKHVLFIGGYGLLTLAIASRVTWGHSGNIHLAEGKRRPLQVILGIVLLGLTTRVVADFIPTIRVSHHIYAALSWVIAVTIWSWAALRYMWISDPTND